MKMKQLKRVFLTTCLMGLLLCATAASASAATPEEVSILKSALFRLGYDDYTGAKVLFVDTSLDASTALALGYDEAQLVFSIPSRDDSWAGYSGVQIWEEESTYSFDGSIARYESDCRFYLNGESTGLQYICDTGLTIQETEILPTPNINVELVDADTSQPYLLFTNVSKNTLYELVLTMKETSGYTVVYGTSFYSGNGTEYIFDKYYLMEVSEDTKTLEMEFNAYEFISVSSDRKIATVGTSDKQKIYMLEHGTTALVSATQYVPYAAQITSGAAIASGSLPKGLGLLSDGTISGIPTQTGTFTFTVDGTEYSITVIEGATTTIEAQNDYDIIEYVPEITSNAVDQIYHIDGPYEDFLAFYINGNKMIEDVEYIAEEGSTVITIFAQTFAAESMGTHTISATFATDDSTVAHVSQQVTKTAEQIVATMPYTDVSESAWYYDYVYLMYRRGIIAGTSATTYSPTSNLTRGMMVDALYQLAGTPAATASSFSDVSADAWYSNAVSWAAEVGVTQGVGDNMFAPETSITREQMATMIQRYCDLMGITLPLYTSATPTDLSTISSWAVDSATAMYQYGVLNGDENGNFNPAGTATRAEAASMFSNFLQILDRT